MNIYTITARRANGTTFKDRICAMSEANARRDFEEAYRDCNRYEIVSITIEERGTAEKQGTVEKCDIVEKLGTIEEERIQLMTTIAQMSDATFDRFLRALPDTITEEDKRVMIMHRAYIKLFTDATYHAAMRQALGEQLYKEFTQA